MIFDVIMVLGEAFLDTLVDRTFKKGSKRKQLFYSIIFALVVLIYLSLFFVFLHIAINTQSIKMFIIPVIILLAFVLYGKEIIYKWKSNRTKK